MGGGVVVGCGDIGTGGGGEGGDEGGALAASGDIAAINKKVRFLGESGLPGGGGFDVAGVQGAGAELDRAFAAVRDDVDGADVAAAGEGGGDLGDAVLAGGEGDDFGIGGDIGEEAAGILNRGVDEDDFGGGDLLLSGLSFDRGHHGD